MKGGEGDFLLESDFLFASKKSDSSNKSSFYHFLGNKKYPVICILHINAMICFTNANNRTRNSIPGKLNSELDLLG